MNPNLFLKGTQTSMFAIAKNNQDIIKLFFPKRDLLF